MKDWHESGQRQIKKVKVVILRAGFGRGWHFWNLKVDLVGLIFRDVSDVSDVSLDAICSKVLYGSAACACACDEIVVTVRSAIQIRSPKKIILPITYAHGAAQQF